MVNSRPQIFLSTLFYGCHVFEVLGGIFLRLSLPMTRNFKYGKWLMVFVSLSFAVNTVLSAQSGNLRCKTISTASKTILDTLVIAPGSLQVKDGIKYHFDMTTRLLTFDSQNDLPDSVSMCYRVFPTSLTAIHYRYDLSEYDSTVFFKDVAESRAPIYNQREEIFKSDNIYKTGNLTRGISFGNSQSLNVNSSLNFQMEGKLSEDLNIRAAITDQNIPFQPEGNTQRLREFDNVFIEVFNDKLSLKAGDLVLKNPNSNFMRYNKNVQGAQLDIKYDLGGHKASSSITASAAKGQFADINIEPLEGVQGPYKLRGPNGERFVVVLANSERVYLDGRLLKRGYNNDYVIDYNLGELIFNPNILITRFSRIRLTYEYSDQNYSRSILNTYHELEVGKTSISFNYYREKDNRNRPLAFELSDEDKLNLSLAGEENLPAKIMSEKEVGFNEDLILYEKRDTTNLDGFSQEAFVFSRDSTRTLFQVTFSEVGASEGDYILLDNTVNGRTFQWVSPQGGVSMGDFDAILFVVAPNMRQMTTIGFESQITDHDAVFGEVAISNQDFNLFSPVGDENNGGAAFKLGYKMKDRTLSFSSDYKLSMSVDFEHDGTNFRGIDRFRYIEYDRDWSYNPEQDTTTNQDNILNFMASFEKDNANKFEYGFSSRKRGQYIDGTQHNALMRKRVGDVMFNSALFVMNNQRQEDESEWKKGHFETFYDRLAIVPGYEFRFDLNELRRSESDSVTGSAMNFLAHQFYLRSNDSLRTKFRLEHITRQDRTAREGLIQNFTQSNTTNVSTTTEIGTHSSVNLMFTYRRLRFTNQAEQLDDEETILGRFDWTGKYLDNHVTTEISYATSSSREVRREFVFLPVNNGEGTHTWRDLNNDGIQDITEFFEAINLDERNYIKLFVPTDEFISAFNNVLNLSLNARMPRQWRKEQGMKKLLSKFANRAIVNINKKNTDDGFQSRFNPFALNTSDDNLVFVKTSFRNNLFFNKSNPGLGLDFEYFRSNSKQLISQGIETRNTNRSTLNSRMAFSKEFSINWSIFNETKTNNSDFLEGRDFNILTHAVTPQFVWQPSLRLRISTRYEFRTKENTIAVDSDESSKINAISADLRWTKAVVNSLDFTVKYLNINFKGDENTLSAYELLEALRPGKNFTWNLNYRQKLTNGLQMTLGYNGRKSPGQRVIHLGRMQLTALF